MPVPYPQPRTPGLLLYAEMPAQTSPQPDIWRWLWRIATGNALLAASLLAVILYWLILTIFPQFSSDADLLASWAAQTRFGRATGFLHRIGLFSAGNSPLIPLLLSVLGFAVLLRAFGRGEVLLRSLRNRTPPLSAIFPAIAEIGALLLLCGLLIGRVGGWRVEGLVGETGTIVPGRGLTLEMTPAGPRVQPGDARAYVVGYGPRLTLRALDAQGRELPLQRTPRESPQPSLSFCLTPPDSGDLPGCFRGRPHSPVSGCRGPLRPPRGGCNGFPRPVRRTGHNRHSRAGPPHTDGGRSPDRNPHRHLPPGRRRT